MYLLHKRSRCCNRALDEKGEWIRVDGKLKWVTKGVFCRGCNKEIDFIAGMFREL